MVGKINKNGLSVNASLLTGNYSNKILSLANAFMITVICSDAEQNMVMLAWINCSRAQWKIDGDSFTFCGVAPRKKWTLLKYLFGNIEQLMSTRNATYARGLRQ